MILYLFPENVCQTDGIRDDIFGVDFLKNLPEFELIFTRLVKQGHSLWLVGIIYRPKSLLVLRIEIKSGAPACPMRPWSA